jgi:hypothetical protein
MSERLIEILKRRINIEKTDKDLSVILSKVEKHKRLSTNEFTRVYELMQLDGPKVKYQNIGTTIHEMHQSRNIQSKLQGF